jgi:hypothetical protein
MAKTKKSEIIEDQVEEIVEPAKEEVVVEEKKEEPQQAGVSSRDYKSKYGK